MDSDAEAVTNFLSVITLPGFYREQPAAYAGLFEALMLQKQDDQVTQWVQNGQAQFAGAGDLQLAFLRDAAKALKRRNNPLWNELDQQIVGLSSSTAGNQLQALREAETNYVAICAMPLRSAEETVNSYLFLAESQTKQGEDITTTMSGLAAQCAGFANPEDCEYGTYRVAKFYDEQGSNDLAAAGYGALVSSLSTSTWAAAALHQLGVLKEKQGDLQGALQLYLQYPQSFPQSDRLVMQSYASALNAADTLGDTNAAGVVLDAITNRIALIQDYNIHLNLAFHYYYKKSNPVLGRSFLEKGIMLAGQSLSATTDPSLRCLIHFRVLRRLCDFGQLQRVLEYFAANNNDFPPISQNPSDNAWFCVYFKALALYGVGQQSEAGNQLQSLLDQVVGNSKLEAAFAEMLGYLTMTGTNTQAGIQLLQTVANKYPSHPWINLGRLQLAAYRFNQGDQAGALALADEIISSTSADNKSTSIRQTHWSAVYIRGRCLQLQGDVHLGQALIQSALAQIPGTQIQLLIN